MGTKNRCSKFNSKVKPGPQNLKYTDVLAKSNATAVDGSPSSEKTIITNIKTAAQRMLVIC